MNSYDFNERLEWSQGIASRANIREILLFNIPAITNVEKASTGEDKSGTDWWGIRDYGLPRLSIDLKARENDCQNFGNDDLALETWSVIDQKVGWTRDMSKRTDYIMWLFTDTKRWVLVPFPMLCQIYIEKWEEWRGKFKTCRQKSKGWESECTFVPRKLIWSELYRRYA